VGGIQRSTGLSSNNPLSNYWQLITTSTNRGPDPSEYQTMRIRNGKTSYCRLHELGYECEQDCLSLATDRQLALLNLNLGRNSAMWKWVTGNINLHCREISSCRKSILCSTISGRLSCAYSVVLDVPGSKIDFGRSLCPAES
jgi:hypothetical protein